MKRQIQLDGVRGVGVLVVIVLHHDLILQPLLKSASCSAVDMFFVMSGYLITRTLLASRSNPRFLHNFSVKRAGRILPAHALLMISALVAGVKMAPLAWFGYSFLLGDLMDVTRLTVPVLGVLWSLAIEEHFYLIWPAAIRFLRPSKVLAIACATVALSPILRLVATPFTPDFRAIYFLTPFRMDSIAAGCALALAASAPGWRKFLEKASVALLLAIVVLYVGCGLAWPATFSRDANSPLYNSLGYTLITLGCFFLTAHLLQQPEGWPARWLSIRPLVFLGEISYGMYLFHLPTIALVRKLPRLSGASGADHLLLLAVDLPITILVSWLSFRFMEAPISAWCRRKTRVPAGAEAQALPAVL